MKISELSKNDLIVINDSSKIPVGQVSTVAQFLEDAGSDDGLNVDGDLYCYIPDFDSDVYTAVKEAIDESKWFVFKKSEIPGWFKADEALILDNGEEAEERAQRNSMRSSGSGRGGSGDRRGRDDGRRGGDDRRSYSNDDGMYESGSSNSPKLDDAFTASVQSLFEGGMEDSVESGHKEAKVYVFGSSKGGTGKTFTCLISAYHYAKTHPGERIAVADFDIIDGQVGISIHQIQPTMLAFWRVWQQGDHSFKAMREHCAKSENFPNNVDFYLAPKDYYINNKDFWLDILNNLITNYDTVFFDTGIDYINYPPIAFTYKIADRIVLVSTTSIKSVSSVLKQISKLKGLSSSADANGYEVFTKEDGIGPKLRLAITGCEKSDQMNDMVINTFNNNIKINAIFGQISSTIAKAEYYGQWNVFDNNTKFNEALDKLVDMDM